MNLGEKIQHFRKKMNLSQEQLAEQCNVTRQAVSKWELNESVPDVDKIIQLSRVFNVSTDDIILKEPLESNMNQEFYIRKAKINQLMIAATALNICGMIFGLFYREKTYETVFHLAVILQVLSILLFEFFLQRVRNENHDSTRKVFYSLNLLIFWVSPSFSLSSLAWSLTVILFEILAFESIMTVFNLSQLIIYGTLCLMSYTVFFLFMTKKKRHTFNTD